MASKNQGRSSPRKRFGIVQNESENATETTESGVSSSDMLNNAVNVTTGSSSQTESSSEDEDAMLDRLVKRKHTGFLDNVYTDIKGW